jgi:hypothetical protein
MEMPMQKGWLRRVEISSPTVAHELAITTAYEKSFAIFSRVSLHFVDITPQITSDRLIQASS